MSEWCRNVLLAVLIPGSSKSPTPTKRKKEGFLMCQEKTLVCKDCNNEFVFTVGEQEFYAEKGFQNEPARCKDCRSARKNVSGDRKSSVKRERVMYDAVCAECGKDTQIPFKPTNLRPIYCKECFDKNK
jgi:CxxC-x17-CxxC domain-containing protein